VELPEAKSGALMLVISLLVLSIAAGLLLGLRFNALVLLPAIGVGLAVGIISLTAAYNSRWVIAVGTVGILATLEIGYIVGALFRAYSAAKLGAPSQRGDWLPTLPTRS